MTTTDQLAAIASAIGYPDKWDTAGAFPTLEDALCSIFDKSLTTPAAPVGAPALDVGEIEECLNSCFISYHDSNGIPTDPKYLATLANYGAIDIADMLAAAPAAPAQPQAAALTDRDIELIALTVYRIHDGRYYGPDMWELTKFARAIERAALAQSAGQSVTGILLEVVPGDGSGHEVYAKTADDVVRKLTELSERIDELEYAGLSDDRLWRIDTTAGRPILVYKDCSVIEDEQARYVMQLIAAAGQSDDKRDAERLDAMRDAARWRTVLEKVSGQRDFGPVDRFALTSIVPLAGADIMRGSVAEHFTKAVDAIIQAKGGAA